MHIAWRIFQLLKFVHYLLRGAVKLVLSADIIASFHDRSLNVIRQGRKKYLCCFAPIKKAVEVFKSSHTLTSFHADIFCSFPKNIPAG